MTNFRVDARCKDALIIPAVCEPCTLAQAIEALIAHNGSLRQLSRLSGVHASYLTCLRKGRKTNPGDETLAALHLVAQPRTYAFTP